MSEGSSSFFKCNHDPTQSPVLACRVGRVGIWIDLMRVMATFLDNFRNFVSEFGSFICLITHCWDIFTLIEGVGSFFIV